VGFGSFLFFLGVAFCYCIIMQVALLATVQFSSWLGFVADEWRADAYISFVSKFMLGMGISFQLPVVLLTMVKIGLLDYQKLSKFRTYWVVINLVICAFATPSGDPVTMLTMAIPLHILYEISVFIAWLWRRRDVATKT
jgi:sec-independent protein translocase protein TatC